MLSVGIIVSISRKLAEVRSVGDRLVARVDVGQVVPPLAQVLHLSAFPASAWALVIGAGTLPWVLRGSAAAMMRRRYPDVAQSLSGSASATAT